MAVPLRFGFFGVVGLALLISMILMWGIMTTGQGWGGDFAQYISQAESILAGEVSLQVERSKWIAENSTYPLGPISYPWGVPLWLCPILAWSGGVNIVALKWVGIGSFLGFLASAAWVFRSRHSLPWLALFLAFFATNMVMLIQADRIGSDLPFLWISTLALGMIHRVLERDRGWAAGVGLGIVLGLAILLRLNGILLVVALGAGQLWRLIEPVLDKKKPSSTLFESKSWREALGVSGTVSWGICLLLVGGISLLLPTGGVSHFAQLDDVSTTSVVRNIQYYIELPASFFLAVPHREMVYGMLFVLAIGGMIRAGRRDVVMIVYFVATCGLYVLWPWQQGIRFLYPIAPLFLSWALESIERFELGSKPLARRFQRGAFLMIGMICVFYFLTQSVGRIKRNLRDDRQISVGPYTDAATEMFTYVDREVPADSRIVFFKPRVMQLLIGRVGVLENRNEKIQSGDVIVYYLPGKADAQVDLTFLERSRAAGNAMMVFENTDFRIYRINTVFSEQGS